MMNRKGREASPHEAYRDFCDRESGAGIPSAIAPSTLQGWNERLARVRAALIESMGRMPDAACALEPELLGTIERDGYAIERLTFQSRPGVRVTANLYRPHPVRGPYPAMLSVHGHWAWARMDPHVQPRCIGLAKLGYVVLSVDAFGAGERALHPGAGTYHGAVLGASLWPLGTPLIGLQVYDNRRAVDYLVSRSDVDQGKLAITGASGGGNQTLYAGAIDERFSAVIPVCGIGTYDAYLSTACCVCEVNPGGARYAKAGDLLAMIAPRALMVISATRDAFQFSVGEAAKSIDHARSRFRLLGHEKKLRHVSVNSGHDYNKPMREAMYGWVEKWLSGRGDGTPIPEPELTVEEIATLRCFADESSRPPTVVTIPAFTRLEWLGRQKSLPPVPDHEAQWKADSERMKAVLRDRVLGPFPPRTPLDVRSSKSNQGVEVSIMTEDGIRSRARAGTSAGKRSGTAIFISIPEKASDSVPTERSESLIKQWTGFGFRTLEIIEPRGTGAWLTGTPPIVGSADHTVAEWGLWVGRPLLGQWVWDLIRWLDFLEETARAGQFERYGMPVLEKPYVLVAEGPMTIAAILAAALDPRVSAVSCSKCLISYVARSDRAWSGVPMGLLAPNILEGGDVDRLAALVAPRVLSIASAREPEGDAAKPDRLENAFHFTRSVYSLMGNADGFVLGPADGRPLPPLGK